MLNGRQCPPKVNKHRVRLAFNDKQRSMHEKLIYLYGKERGGLACDKIQRKINAFRKKKPKRLRYKDSHFDPKNRFTQRDSILISYADSIRQPRTKPLQTLCNFAIRYLSDVVNTIHLLPFYPSSSDRGFSVKNYKKVEPRFGSWKEIKKLGTNFDLMFDGVFNHISSKSRWFKQWLRKNPLYDNHFIAFERKDDITAEELAKITRPRTNELLTPFKTKDGVRYVWTTFSKDQVDLNFKEPVVLLRIVDVLFRYIRNGATFIRLDAANYLWKELGTSCSHLKQTHVIIQLLRDILDVAAPSVNLVTETNVPHGKNISYLGNGRNEAQMVYNFSLPPLVLHALYTGNASYISRWADRLEKTSPNSTYFNFLASHDGIGLMPIRRLLPQRDVQRMIKKAKQHGSLVSYKQENGQRVPYELNITWWNAINNLNQKESHETRVRRYLASFAIAFCLKGVPGIYLHALLATENDNAAVKRSGVNRDINRKNTTYAIVTKALRQETHIKAVFAGLKELLHVRSTHTAFDPNAEQNIIHDNKQVFTVLRSNGNENVLCMVNVSGDEQYCRLQLDELGLQTPLYDLLKKRRILATKDVHAVHSFTLKLSPYEIRWLKSSLKRIIL